MSMSHDEKIAVITHHKNGGMIECRARHSTNEAGWRDATHLAVAEFDFVEFDYRIKKEPMVLWVVIAEEGYVYAFSRDKYEVLDCLDPPTKNRTLKKFVEVACDE